MAEVIKTGNAPTNEQLAQYTVRCLFGSQRQFDSFFTGRIKEAGTAWIGNADMEAFKREVKELVESINNMNDADREKSKRMIRDFFELHSIGNTGMKRFRDGVEKLAKSEVDVAALEKQFGYPKNFKEAVAPARKAEKKKAAQPIPQTVDVNLEIYGLKKPRELRLGNFYYEGERSRLGASVQQSGTEILDSKFDRMQMDLVTLQIDAIKKYAEMGGEKNIALSESTFSLVVNTLFWKGGLKINQVNENFRNMSQLQLNLSVELKELRGMAGKGDFSNPEFSKKFAQFSTDYAAYMGMRARFEVDAQRYIVDTPEEYAQAGLMKALDVLQVVALVTGVGAVAGMASAGSRELGKAAVITLLKEAAKKGAARAAATSAVFTAIFAGSEYASVNTLNRALGEFERNSRDGIAATRGLLHELENKADFATRQRIRNLEIRLDALQQNAIRENKVDWAKAGMVFAETFALCMVIETSMGMARGVRANINQYAGEEGFERTFSREGKYIYEKTGTGMQKLLRFKIADVNGKEVARDVHTGKLYEVKSVIRPQLPANELPVIPKVYRMGDAKYVPNKNNPMELRITDPKKAFGATPEIIKLGRGRKYALGDNSVPYEVTSLGEEGLLRPVNEAMAALKEAKAAKPKAPVETPMKKTQATRREAVPEENLDESTAKFTNQWLLKENSNLAEKLKIAITPNRRSIIGFGEPPKISSALLRMCEVREIPPNSDLERTWSITLRARTPNEGALKEILDALQASRSKLEVIHNIAPE
ncbi:MAG: hypothetical protein PHS02_00170 [Candidatus ainarchaeum sp.]|nr:hypothetical protein [Candidatus ainarchaeum sp.]